MTVTPVDTIQHCSPCLLNPEMPPDVYMRLESNKCKMEPELKELEPPSAGTGLETPGQQCPPNKGTWEKGRTIADGYSLVGMGSNQGGNIFSPTTESVDTRAARTTADITFLQQGHKPKKRIKAAKRTSSLTPVEKERRPLWNAAVTLRFFFCGERWAVGGSLLMLRVFCLCVSFCSVL